MALHPLGSAYAQQIEPIRQHGLDTPDEAQARARDIGTLAQYPVPVVVGVNLKLF